MADDTFMDRLSSLNSCIICACAGLGSQALQRARNWKPAKAATPSQVTSLDTLDEMAALQAAGPAGEDAGADARDAAGDDVDGGALAGEAAAVNGGKHSGKMHFTHPGYYSASAGPVYTPAPPEAALAVRREQFSCTSPMQPAASDPLRARPCF